MLSASLLSRYLPSPDRIPDQLKTLSMFWGWLLFLVLLQVLHHLLGALIREARGVLRGRRWLYSTRLFSTQLLRLASLKFTFLLAQNTKFTLRLAIEMPNCWGWLQTSPAPWVRPGLLAPGCLLVLRGQGGLLLSGVSAVWSSSTGGGGFAQLLGHHLHHL